MMNSILLVCTLFLSHSINHANAFSLRSLSPTSTRKSTLTRAPAVLVDDAALSAVDNFFQTQPYAAAFLTCSFKASAADLVAQKREVQVKKPDGVDVYRNLGFLFYGGLYQGLAQQFIYSVLFPSIFGSDSSFFSVAMQVFLDLAIIGPFFCLPLCYTIKSFFQSDGQMSVDIVKSALDKYVEDVLERGLLVKYSAIWIPAQSLTFSVIPTHLRVVFVAVVSFFWVCVLSTVSSSEEKKQETEPKLNLV